MKKISSIGRAAATVAIVIASAALAREAGGGRKLASALGRAPADMSGIGLQRGSAALQRHLKHNPRDLLAANLLNDVDTEIIRRG